MALPRKGTRRITVDEHQLRWLMRPGKDAFRLVVERDAEPGQRLVCTVPMAYFPRDARILSPAIVEQCVRAALAAEFDPNVPRGEVRFTVTREHLDFGAVNTEELKPRPVGRPRKRAVGEKRRPVYVSFETADRERFDAVAKRLGTRPGTLARTWLLERLAQEE